MSIPDPLHDYDPFAPTSIQAQAKRLDDATLTALGLSTEDAASLQNLRQKYVKKKPVQWDAVTAPAKDFYVDSVPFPPVKDDAESKGLLEKLVVVKLNGGLGTSMGCKGPKSTIEVSHGNTFLDFDVNHIQALNKKHGVDIPLVLMNSFHTDAETKKTILKYEGSNVHVASFVQSKFPRLYKDTLNLVPKASAPFNGKDWYPPGSGNIFASFKNSGLLEKFIKEGKEYMFISNVESLGATVDTRLLKHVLEQKIDFAIEVTDRISTDMIGGMLVKYEGKIHLMEMSQVPHSRHNQFLAFKHKYWNTNNLWVHLPTLRTLLEKGPLDLDFVLNLANGGREIQLETPAGMAIQNFLNPHAIHVRRDRYRPVKSTSQLMLIQSNIFKFQDGRMVMNERREPPTVPLIKLGEEFREVPDYQKRFKSVPNLLELEHLTVSGDVWFGADITLKGTIIIVAEQGERIDIPDGVTLENKIVSGNLRIVDH